MKKTAILLILVMIISLIPALSVSAADEYYLKGLYQGETVVIQQEPTKTVTLVDAANATTPEPTESSKPVSINTTATNVAKVVYTFNNNDPVTIMGANLSYTMTFEHTGTQTLKYDVYKTGNSSNTPDESKTITFKAVAGTKNAASVPLQTFENVTAANLAKTIVANDGANNNGHITLATATWNNSTALQLKSDSCTKSGFLQLKGAPNATGHKVHYYNFDISMNNTYTITLYDTEAAYTSTAAATRTQLFRNKSLTKHSSSYKTVNVDLILDYNYESGGAPTASIFFDGVEWGRMTLTNATGDTENPVEHVLSLYMQCRSLTAYIDNFSYTAYDVVPTPTFTGASIAGGADKPVQRGLSEVRFTGSSTYLAGQDAADFVTLSERANDSTGDFTTSSIAYTPYIDGTDVVVTFDDELAEATTYKIEIKKLQDTYLNYYNDYSFTFRTLNPGENPLPEISLTSPVADARYYPNEGDSVTLSAEAFDTLDGTIAKVEFYADGELIGEGTNTEGNTYTYEWVLDGSIDREEPVAITAKAVDNENGVSETMPVNITLRSKSEPDVTITSPATGTVLCSNLAGKDIEVKPTIEFTAEDADGTIEAINVYVDGVSEEGTIDPTATTYTLATDLAVGTHRITVEVYDDHGLNSMDEIEVVVEDRGKSGFLINEDYTSENLVAKWAGNADASYAEGTGIVAKAVKSENADGSIAYTAGKLSRTIMTNFTDKDFAADIKVSFDDTTSKRVIGLDYKEPDASSVKTIELVTFADNGKITFGGTQVGTMTYNAGQTYNISIIADEKNDKVYVLVDGTEVGTPDAKIGVSPKMTITQEGAGSTAIARCGASMLGTAVVPVVNANGKSFTVDFPAGTDLATLEGNVSMLDSTGKAVSLSYADGVFTVNGVLKTTETYEIIVLPDARDINGNGYCGTMKANFTAPAPTTVVATVADTGTGWDATNKEYNAELTVSFAGVYDASTVVHLVCAAYDGKKMVDIYTVDVTPETATKNFTLENVDDNTVIEAFVVDNLDDLNSVNDRIFVIK